MTLPNNILAHLANRSAYAPRWLFHAWPKDRATEVEVPFGIWSGDYATTIGGRDYVPASGAFDLGAIIYATGLQVRDQGLSLTRSAPETRALLDQYDATHARAEITLALFDPSTGGLVGTHRVWTGQIDGAPATVPVPGGASQVSLSIASSVVKLTRTLGIKKTDESQKLRGGDRGRRYSALGTTANDPRGGK